MLKLLELFWVKKSERPEITQYSLGDIFGTDIQSVNFVLSCRNPYSVRANVFYVELFS